MSSFHLTMNRPSLPQVFCTLVNDSQNWGGFKKQAKAIVSNIFLPRKFRTENYMFILKKLTGIKNKTNGKLQK